ncbi:hypothetical protein P0082_11590 [Candidatus Haliotispira prima]|uniref:Lipoprotein n=1 Tax=Candidatus Haliotispira prima TaxID=3034016 RepID=A0ABY8MGT8_9SPIO|nr:hypothetical protein P0082_11590 [Candidatus Haliotispira prima]
MVLSGCAPLSETNDPPAPKSTFTISFTGIQAVELTVNLIEDMAVSAIVRLAGEPAPVWADIKDKVGLLTCDIVANTPKRIFTAKHYGTNDSLKTNIGAMSAADFLQPETAYKVYVFRDKSVIETLPFTTVAIPPASEFPSAGSTTTSSDKFAPNVLPFDAEIIYNDFNGIEKKGVYEVYGKEEEILLIPMYMKQLLNIGWRFRNFEGFNRIECNLSSCLPSGGGTGYVMTWESIYPSVAANTYQKVLLGFQSFNKDLGDTVSRDAGDTALRDGDEQGYHIRLIADQ